MNSLSWFIYLADVVDGVQGVAVTVFVFAGLALVIAAFVAAVSYKKHEKEDRTACVSVVKRLAPIVIIAAILLIFVPSQRTVLMIAASEFGEELTQTETASKAQQALDKFLSDYLEDDG